MLFSGWFFPCRFFILLLARLNPSFTGFPKITKLWEITDVVISTPSSKLSASLQPVDEVAAKNEEKMKKKRISLDSSDTHAEVKKRKRIMLRVRKSTKKTSDARVPNFEALRQHKDFPEDDEDMKLITTSRMTGKTLIKSWCPLRRMLVRPNHH